jgi:hypothetical protein
MSWSEQRGWVYVARSGGMHKIGKSAEPEARVRQVKAPWGPVTLVHVVRTEHMTDTEAALHARFSRFRVEGNDVPGSEWFALPDADLAWLLSVSELTFSFAEAVGFGAGERDRGIWLVTAHQRRPGGMFLRVARRCGGVVCYSRHCPACARDFFNFVRGPNAKQAKDAGADIPL